MIRSRPKWRVRWCAAFSPITTAWSIRMPTEIEIPARLMMFDEMPNSRIRRKLNRIASGRVTATTKALLGAGASVASCHLSHSYLDGACLYFTFAAKPPAEQIEDTYAAELDFRQLPLVTLVRADAHSYCLEFEKTHTFFLEGPGGTVREGRCYLVSGRHKLA